MLLSVCCAMVSAQTIHVSVPQKVSAGENFRLSYTVYTQDVKGFKIGNVPSELEVIIGPNVSQQSSIQMVNGKTSGSSSVTYTYILYAAKNGTYTIPPAHATVGGRNVASRAAKVVVTGTAKNNSGAPKMHGDDDYGQRTRPAGTRISGNDLFIKVSANKTTVYEQEPVLLTYKVYTQLDLTQLEGKMPDLTGFHTQEIPLPQQKSFHVENVNGLPYRCVTWSQYVMFPQMTGKLDIPSITFNGTVVQRSESVDPMEAFFNGGASYVEVQRAVKAPALKINVQPLPQRPADFSGGVGRFNVSASLLQHTVKAGDAVTLRVTVDGIGNLKLLKQPRIDFPKDFDKYNPKTIDKTKVTTKGVEGQMVYDYLIVPRHQGNYIIPPVSFVYYDLAAGAYKTLQTKPLSLTVTKGNGKDLTVDDYSARTASDIRPLKKGALRANGFGDAFFGGAAYFLLLLLLCAAFVGALWFLRKRAADATDVVGIRNRKANKEAVKRLRKASALMKQHNNALFYDEVLRALWGYVGDKLNMPVESLSRENISEQLSARQVDANTVSAFIKALDDCEYARYAPGDVQGNMNHTYCLATDAIVEIENVMKQRKNKKHRAPVLLIRLVLAAMLLPLQSVTGTTVAVPLQPLPAMSKEEADNAYAKGMYQKAIEGYTALLKDTPSSDVYYNLGNAYFRTNNLTRAILNYERALLLSPGDADIRFNLQFANSKLIDKPAPENEMFFVTWYYAVVNSMSVDAWAIFAVIALAASLALCLCYLFGGSVWYRRVGFYGCVVFFFLFLAANLFAYQQKKRLAQRTGAIIIAPKVEVRKTPAGNGNIDFVLHEGTKVNITDDGVKGWYEVSLSDGRTGWLTTRSIEKI